jgi:hypothetical protein
MFSGLRLQQLRQLKLGALTKSAFVDPNAMGGMPPNMPADAAMGDPMMAMPPGGAPPMDPAMMGGGLPPGMPMDPAMMGGAPMDPAMMGGAPPMDPAMMGGAPPMDTAMMGGAPPAPPAPPMDPSMAMMGNQETLKQVIREVLQEMGLGGDNAGQGIAAPKKGNKMDEAIASLREDMKEQQKILVAALRNADIDISLADLYGLEKGREAGGGSLGAPGAGISEDLAVGLSPHDSLGASGKMASLSFDDGDEADVQALMRLMRAKDNIKSSAMASKLGSYAPVNPMASELDYLAGLYR